MSNVEGKSRAEHVRWCKQRAWEAYNYEKATHPHGALHSAVASMISDLGKHEATRNMLETAAFVALTVRDERSLRSFIDGFAE